jgi:hypothetical protein
MPARSETSRGKENMQDAFFEIVDQFDGTQDSKDAIQREIDELIQPRKFTIETMKDTIAVIERDYPSAMYSVESYTTLKLQSKTHQDWKNLLMDLLFNILSVNPRQTITITEFQEVKGQVALLFVEIERLYAEIGRLNAEIDRLKRR